MSYKANKIIDRLYQGGFPPMGDGLKNAGVDVLVLCAREHQSASDYEGVQVILAPGDDNKRPHRLLRFIETWKEAGLQVAEHVKSGKTVLVTCMAGLNRSGLVTAIALSHLTDWSGERIVEHIQAHREMALCNDTFVKYIIDNYPKTES